MNQFQDNNKLDTRHLITESKSVPSSRRNSGHNPSAFQLQPNLQHNLQHNLSANVLNSTFSNQISASQLMNRRPSSSTAIVTTSTSNQFLNTQTPVLNVSNTLGTSAMKTASTSAINLVKSKPDHLSSSANHLTTLDPMNYVGTELMKTASVTLTTNTMSGKQFLDINNNSNAYNNLRRKSSSALSNSPKFNRTLSLRSNSTNEVEIANAPSNLNANTVDQQQQIQQTGLLIQPQQFVQHQQQQHHHHQHLQQQNSLTIQNQADCPAALTRQASIQMRSSPMMKSMTDMDKQTEKSKINYTASSTSISSSIATPIRRPSSSASGNQMQPQRCISAMDTLRRSKLSISANSCSSSDELTDTESLSKVGLNAKNEVDNCLRNGKIIGQIKLGIIMTKGLLEIDILEAKLDSSKIQNPNKPGTY